MEKNLRRRRKAKRNKLFLKLIILAIEMVILFTVLRRSTLFKLKTIDVIGNNRLTKERILEVSGLSYGKNLLRLSKSVTEQNIQREPYVERVRVKKKLMNRLVVEVSEKKPIAYFVTEKGNVVVDSNLTFLEIVEQGEQEHEWTECRGFFEIAPTDEESLKKGLSTFIDNDFFGHFFNSILAEKVQKIECIQNHLYLYLKDSSEVIFGDPYESAYKIDLLSEIFRDLEANKIRVKRIDMRQKWPIITKVEGEEDESE